MTTLLDKSLKREIVIEQAPYTLQISPEGLHLAPKGRRKGIELRWVDLVSGEAALAVALNASLASVQGFPEPRPATEEPARDSKQRMTRAATEQPIEAPRDSKARVTRPAAAKPIKPVRGSNHRMPARKK